MFSLEYSPSPRFVIRRSFPFSATSTMVFAAGRTFEKEKKKETEKFITIKTNIFAIPQSAWKNIRRHGRLDKKKEAQDANSCEMTKHRVKCSPKTQNPFLSGNGWIEKEIEREAK